MKRAIIALSISLMVFALQISFAMEKGGTTIRYALIIGADDAGAQRPALRYAQSDAIAVWELFQELGGLSKNNGSLLLNPGLAEVKQSLQLLQAQLANLNRGDTRSEIIFYYSGHSDETGLLLKNGKLSYLDLHRMIQDIRGDLKIAIFDSCASGSITRIKGGVSTPPFLMDESNTLEGQVYITSSSENESAQESDKIASSFFTYHLLSALRGAGDTSLDGKVTLNEAYQYAYNETLSHTERTLAGAQHPSYDIRLNGSGEVVLTNTGDSSYQLIFTDDLNGKLFIRNESNHLLAEIAKVKGKKTLLAIPAGRYLVSLKNSDGLFEANLTVADNRDLVITIGNFKEIELQQTQNRGKVSAKSELYSTLAVGNHLQSIRFVSRGGSFQQGGDPSVNSQMTGPRLSYTVALPKDYFLSASYYRAEDQGKIVGYSVGLNYNLFDLYKNKKSLVQLFVGVGFVIEDFEPQSTGIPAMNQGFREYPVGIRANYKDFQITLETSTRSGDRSSFNTGELYTTDVSSVTSIRVGKRF